MQMEICGIDSKCSNDFFGEIGKNNDVGCLRFLGHAE